MKSFFAALMLVCLATVAYAAEPGAAGAPGAADAGGVKGEYDPATGEFMISSGGAVNFYMESASKAIVPLGAPPAGVVGLLTNNTGRIGMTNLGPINLTDFSFGNVGKGLLASDLKLVYTSALGQAAKTILPSEDGSTAFRYVPEPASIGMVALGLVGLLGARRRG